MLQLTPHLHVLVPDALWRGDGEALAVPPPTDDEVTVNDHRDPRESGRSTKSFTFTSRS